MFTVVYCPEFYIQCERIFRPELNGQALAVIATDTMGNPSILASSLEARAKGITPAQYGPEIVEVLNTLISDQSIHICAPNYELYASVSTRFIDSLELLAPTVTALAHDEALVCLPDLKADSSALEVGVNIREKLSQWLGVTALIGIGPTKTLARSACTAAETFDEFKGVVDLCSTLTRQTVLSRISVGNVKGVSKSAAARLSAVNIRTALEMSLASKALVRRHSSVVVESIALELSGLQCHEPEVAFNSPKTDLTLGRTPIKHSLVELKRELNSLVSSAQERLIRIASTCKTVTVVLTTPSLNQQDPPFEYTLTADLVKAGNATGSILQLAGQLLESLWQEKRQYHSLILSLGDLNPAQSDQFGLFVGTAIEPAKLQTSNCTQSIVQETLVLADLPNNKKNTELWRHKKLSQSPYFTTRWGDLPRVS